MNPTPSSNPLASFLQEQLASLLITLAFLAGLVYLLSTGVLRNDDVLVSSLLTLIASYWFTSAAHRAGGTAAAMAGRTAIGALLTPPPVMPAAEPAPPPIEPAPVSLTENTHAA